MATLPVKAQAHTPKIASFQIGVASITKLIKGLNIHKAAGPNLINGRLLKECCDACAPILQLIFQRSLESGTIPNDWCNVNVIPLFKKGECYKAANYRPVSLTSICSKLIEHVIVSQLMGHLNTNNILYDLPTWLLG